MHRVEKSIIESFMKQREQTISELSNNISIPTRTLNRYVDKLIMKNKLEAYGKGRGRYYQLKEQVTYEPIAVFKSASLLGYLSYQEGRYGFEYDQSYKGKKLDGLLGDGPFHGTILFTIFENLIPESDRRDAYVAEGQNLVQILLELENTHGDFDFVSVDKLHGYDQDYTHRKPWMHVKEMILEEQVFPNILGLSIEIEKAILEDKGKHSSLSGYQNKIDVHVDFENKRILQSTNALYLLKPYNVESAVYDFRDKNQTYLPYLGLNEHLFMSFAKNAYGFDVPWSAIVVGEKDFHYVVKRYDRYDGYKYEQRDFAQVMNIKSDQKYFTTSEKLFDAIATVVKSKEERVLFLEFYIFSFVIEYADLHIKNISIINMGKDKYRLSPLYDLISNGVYRGDSDELGLPLAGKKHNITMSDFYDLSSRLGISKLQTKKSLTKIVNIFVEEFPSYIKIAQEIKEFEGMKIKKNRYSFGSFSENLEKFYVRRVKSLKERGFL